MKSLIRIWCFQSPGASVNGRANAALLDHDIALRRRHGLILAGLGDPGHRRRVGLSTWKIMTGSETRVLAFSPAVQVTNPSG